MQICLQKFNRRDAPHQIIVYGIQNNCITSSRARDPAVSGSCKCGQPAAISVSLGIVSHKCRTRQKWRYLRVQKYFSRKKQIVVRGTVSKSPVLHSYDMNPEQIDDPSPFATHCFSKTLWQSRRNSALSCSFPTIWGN